MAFDTLKKHPVITGVVAFVVFLVWTLPQWLATLWPALVRDKTIPEWMAEQRWSIVTPTVYGALTILFLFVLGALVFVAIRGNKTTTRGGCLSEGPVRWQLMKVAVQIPDARQSLQPNLWADGLGRWDSFAVHNLWANRPATKGDLELWKAECYRWSADVKAWMETAGCPFLDVKEFAELGNIQGGPFHPDPDLNYQLVMLNMKRDRLASLITRFRSMPILSILKPVITVDVGPGTARPGDGRMLPSADIRLTNSGDPFTLVVFAKLLNVSPGFAGADQWRYIPRQINGGNDTTGFHIATLGAPVVTDTGLDWLVKLRGEHFQAIRRWQGRTALQFDVEWTFQADVDSVNRPLAIVVTRVTLSDDRQHLDVVKLSETIMPSVLQRTAPLPSQGA
jgi:hypothetical protein